MIEQLTLHSNNLSLQLDSFEGPLDLLLHLIRKRDIDIFDIPIHQIAEEFQTYVDWIQTIDLEQAGDYLSTAAELAHIKSRMLLPKDENDEEDPRDPLVQRLLAFEQMQEGVEYLDQCQLLGKDVFVRGNDLSEDVPPPPIKPSEIEPFELQSILNKLLKKARKIHSSYHPIQREAMTVRQRILWLCQKLEGLKSIRLSELQLEDWDKATLIVTFLALLELCRLRRIRLQQVDEMDLLLEAIGSLDDIPLHTVDSFADSFEQLQEKKKKPKRKRKKRKKEEFIF